MEFLLPDRRGFTNQRDAYNDPRPEVAGLC